MNRPSFLIRCSLVEGGSQRGGLGNLSAIALAKEEAHQLFGEQLRKLLVKLNEVLTE
jgi:hypothetical protein